MEALREFFSSVAQPKRRTHKALLTALLVVFGFAAVVLIAPRAWALDACYTGSWYDPAAPGEGVSVEVLDDTVLVYFYRGDGEWFALQGDDVGLTAYQLWAGQVIEVGSGAFVPVGPNTAIFVYGLLLDLEIASPQFPIPWCLRSDCSDEMELQRLTQPIPCE